MTDSKIIGCLIEATAPRRPKRRGVVLPPARRSRTGALRLAVDGKKPVPFNPGEWTVTVKAGPVYGYGELPAEHLATRTMLRTEGRLEPVDGAAGIAEYIVRKGTVPLYAVADAVPMPALSPVRADAWTTARTCVRCGEIRRRPLPAYRGAGRLCDPCQKTVAEERWTGQARVVQAAAAAWAREVLADPRTLLVAKAYDWRRPHIRIETLGDNTAADVIVDTCLRDIQDLDDWQTRHRADRTAEDNAAWRATYDGTIPKGEFHPVAASLQASRLVAWSDRDAWLEGVSMPHVAASDQLGDRLALWSGEAPGRFGNWYPEPRLPWSQYPQRCEAHRAHRGLRQAGGDLEAEIEGLRSALHLMAEQQPPEPTAGPVVVTR